MKPRLACTVVVLFHLWIQDGAATNRRHVRNRKLPGGASIIDGKIVHSDGRTRFIVQMQGEPILGNALTKPLPGERVDKNHPAVVEYRNALEAKHETMANTMGVIKILSYTYAFNGFAVSLNKDEAEKMSSLDGITQIWEDTLHELVTGSPAQFLGVSGNGGVWDQGFAGEDIVVGIIDTGIIPEHPSFADTSTPQFGNEGPVIPYGGTPTGFSGSDCKFGNQRFNKNDISFNCNNKILSASCYASAFSYRASRLFPCGGDGFLLQDSEFLSARDSVGHGTHVSSIAGGNNGVEAIINGTNLGTITGIAPRARIAVYKVCWSFKFASLCPDTDILAAVDQAIADGADVLNLSLGVSSTSIAPSDIALLYAVQAGIHVAVSAGNDGPSPNTVAKPGGWPWVAAAAAAWDDAPIGAVVNVSSPAEAKGLYSGPEGDGPVKLAALPAISRDVVVSQPLDACSPVQNDLKNSMALVIRGTCTFSEKYNAVAKAGASIIIVYNDGTAPDRFDPIVMGANGTSIPGLMIGFDDGEFLRQVANTDTVIATVSNAAFPGLIADFSSRGPNTNTSSSIIKPDIAAPGVEILAATSPYGFGNGDDFAYLSGTSMASPHIAGTLALLKQAHPNWSPAKAKSAIMTTANHSVFLDYDLSIHASPFDAGSGYVSPQSALSPGLVFDAQFNDYYAFLCGNNPKDTKASTCDGLAKQGYSFDGSDLNYPSIAIPQLSNNKTVSRTLSNVAGSTKTYTATVVKPVGINIVVKPSTSTLNDGESVKVRVSFSRTGSAAPAKWVFGSITWASDVNKVYMPVAVFPTA